MSLTSNAYLLFVLFAVVVYYLVPAKFQWLVLLTFSYAYYVAGGIRAVFYIVFSTFVTWGFARVIEICRDAGKSDRFLHRLVAAGLICNFGMLGFVKYSNFLIDNLNSLFHLQIPGLQLLFPLGISFYTFQSSGYLLDVYWKKVKAEKSVLRYALFVSFFPQLVQGPISRYDRLAGQLYSPHSFDMGRVAMGVERMIRGYFKKIVIADWAGVFTDAVRSAPDQYKGLAGLGMLFYYIQLYMDFSGAIDVVIGVGELFGITMDENFRRPYLAVSLSNFWKRWHITLGEWMTTYVFYPLSLTRTAHRIAKWGKEKFSRKTGRSLQVAYAEIIVFLLVGIWHGASWFSVVYGLYMGLIIAVSELMSGTFASWKKALHISGKEKGWILFTILRTNFIFWLASVFDMTPTLGGSFRMMLNALTCFTPSQLLTIPAGSQGLAYTPWALLTVAVGTFLVIFVGCLQEKGLNIEAKLKSLPLPASVGICMAVLISIGMFGCTAAAKGFIYAQF